MTQLVDHARHVLIVPLYFPRQSLSERGLGSDVGPMPAVLSGFEKWTQQVNHAPRVLMELMCKYVVLVEQFAKLV